jgi:hypothetical protein
MPNRSQLGRLFNLVGNISQVFQVAIRRGFRLLSSVTAERDNQNDVARLWVQRRI